MNNKSVEKVSALIILIGAPLTTLFILMSSVTDPVNAPKLFLAGGFGVALFSLVATFRLRFSLRNFKVYWILSGFFILASINSVIASTAPLSQNLYGSYGRNTGFIAYLILTCLSLGMLGLSSRDSFRKTIIALQVAGVVNVVYCGWVIVFGDFISWNNPYGNILGLFGNPDFISAFLGIFIATLVAYIFGPETSWRYRVIASTVALVAFLEIVDSHAIQGIVVTGLGIAIVGFFAVRNFFSRNLATFIYLLFAISAGVLAVLGALQKGPLSFIYKTSVSLRGVYWNAGATMGINHPFTGIGMDSYGDWYRRARSLKGATVLPGPKVITNASHNVIMDFFAYGGWPLLLSYLGLLVIAAIAVTKVILRNRKYDSIFVAMTAAWICYIAQAIISINQIGLAIWGWLLTGALVAYEYTTRQGMDSPPTTLKNNKSVGSGVVSPQLVAGLGIVVGLLVAVPPLSADMKWRSALKSQDATKVMAALKPGYLNPADSERLTQAVQLFVTNNLLDQAHQIALQGISHNPDYFDAWRILYALSNSTAAEKAEALKNMKRLDPLNPDILAQ